MQCLSCFGVAPQGVCEESCEVPLFDTSKPAKKKRETDLPANLSRITRWDKIRVFHGPALVLAGTFQANNPVDD